VNNSEFCKCINIGSVIYPSMEQTLGQI